VAAVLEGGGDAQLVLGGDPADHDPVAAVHQGTEDGIVLRELCSGEDATALSEKPDLPGNGRRGLGVVASQHGHPNAGGAVGASALRSPGPAGTLTGTSL
jgi:hypothetical protein